MASTSQINGTRSDAAAFGTGGAKLGKDEFVKLLMTQLQYQDPTSPMDSEAFVAQLAQFANVELLQNANARLEDLLVGQTASQQSASVAWVGKKVLFNTSDVTLEQQGTDVNLMARLSRDAKQVNMAITDASGKTVRTLRLGAQAGGDVSATWDGLDDRGRSVPPGKYSVRVMAADVSGKSIAVSQMGTGRVTGVALDGATPLVIVDGGRVEQSRIIEVQE